MSDSYSEYIDSCNDYLRLCKLLGEKKKADDVDYDHLLVMIGYKCVYFQDGAYHVDFEKYPEFTL